MDLLSQAQGALCRNLLNALPFPVFVVDQDMRMVDLNQAGHKLVADEQALVLRQRSGEVWHCLRASPPVACGQAAFCENCVIRRCVTQSSQGRQVSRERARMDLVRQNGVQETQLLVTTSPFAHQGQSYVLLILEDISELIALRGLLPICVKCKKIRDDRQYWHNIETYLSARLDVDFSHSLCPNCIKDLYPELVERLFPSKPS